MLSWKILQLCCHCLTVGARMVASICPPETDRCTRSAPVFADLDLHAAPVRIEERRPYFGCCCSVFGLAASPARLAIHASYSGVPGRGASAGSPPIQCGISPICTLLQDGSNRTGQVEQPCFDQADC